MRKKGKQNAGGNKKVLERVENAKQPVSVVEWN
jgi:hypothetical protein